jgi:hypothetical protein
MVLVTGCINCKYLLKELSNLGDLDNFQWIQGMADTEMDYDLPDLYPSYYFLVVAKVYLYGMFSPTTSFFGVPQMFGIVKDLA